MTQEAIASQGALAEADAWGALAPLRGDANAPLAGYALWLNPTYRVGSAYQDAARTTPANVGDLVGGLYDATNAITATATGAARPTRSATGLTFAGAQELRDTTMSRAQPETIYVVATMTNTNRLVSASSANLSPTVYMSFSTTFELNAGVALQLTGVALGVLRVFCVCANAASSYLYASGVGGASGNAGTNAGTGIVLGNEALVPRFLVGEIREILVYRAAHDATTRAAEIAKAAARCGVTL
jgi:hypothetical protein